MIRTLWGLLVLTPAVALGAASLLGTYADVPWETYTHTAPEFSVQYPYELHTAPPSRPGEVFSAAAAGRIPAMNVMVLPRPAGLSLGDAAQAAARQFAPNGTILAQDAVDLGGTEGQATTVEWSVPLGAGVDLRSLQVSAFQGDSWVIVTVTDGRVGAAVDPALVEAATSVRFAR
jgi:hypothetical protein